MMYFSQIKVALVCVILLVRSSFASRVLGLLPTNSKSIFGFNIAVMESLANAGHRVTVLCPFPHYRSLSNISFIDSRQNISETSPWLNYDFKTMHFLQNAILVTEFMENDCYNVMKIKEISELMHSCDDKYDVIFVSSIVMYKCYFPLAHKCNVPVIGMLSIRSMVNLDTEFGNPSSPAAVPLTFGSYSKTMTFYERFKNSLDTFCWLLFDQFVQLPKIKKFFTQFSPVPYSKSNTQLSLVFGNSHPSIFSRALVPNYVEIGGIHLENRITKPLPENIRTFIEGADEGVIVLSLGSLIQSKVVEENLRNIFVNVFAEIPQRVIWKFEEDLENITDNVLRLAWLPQQEILAHPNVKVFIGHCGISGVYEAIYGAKPMVLMPVFADQRSNAALLEEIGVGVRLPLLELTEVGLLNAINAVLNNTSYADRMRDLSRAFKDRPMSASDTVVYWTEYVLRHNGTKHLKPVVADMPLYQYFLLDIIAFIISMLLALGFLLYYILRVVSTLQKPKAGKLKENKKQL